LLLSPGYNLAGALSFLPLLLPLIRLLLYPYVDEYAVPVKHQGGNTLPDLKDIGFEESREELVVLAKLPVAISIVV
jgi:hypothetical protein